MADELIKRRELVSRFNNIRRQDWKRVAEKLNLTWSDDYGKGSHAVIRDPNYPDPTDIKGLIATVQKDLYKEANRSIFRHLRQKGIPEDDIWRALDFLKIP